MRLLSLAVFCFGISTSVFAGPNHGRVLCDLSAPIPGGFELVQLRDLNRTFIGTHDVEGLRIKGEYYPLGESLTVNVRTFDNDTMEDGELIVETTTHVSGSDYVKLLLPLPQSYRGGGKMLEMFCRLNWDTN
jgi:hypothetical protein